MNDYGMKVVKSGKDVSSTDIRDWILHSNYSMFKYHSTLTGTITLNAGDQIGTLQVTHGLGYVPAFLVYRDNVLLPSLVKAYADSNKIYITEDWGTPYGQTSETIYSHDLYWEDQIAARGIMAGNRSGNVDGSAIRFVNVDIPQATSISSAVLNYEVGSYGTTDVKFKIYGINEDNTADFSSNPMGRTKTGASRTKTQSQQGSWFTFGDNVKDLVQEIINRGGWSSGNALGFLLNDNGSSNNNYLYSRYPIADNTQINHVYLDITYIGASSNTSNYKVIVFKDRIA